MFYLQVFSRPYPKHHPQPLKSFTYRCVSPRFHPPSHNLWKVLPTGFDFIPIQSKTLLTLPQPVKSSTYRCFPDSIQNATHPPTTRKKFYHQVFSRLYPKRHPPSHNPWKVLPTGVFPFTHPPTTRKKFYLQVFSRLYPKRHPPSHNPVKSSTYRCFPVHPPSHNRWKVLPTGVFLTPPSHNPVKSSTYRCFPDPTLPQPPEKFYLQVFSRSPTLPQQWKVLPTGVFPFWSTGAAAGGWM